MAKAKSDDPGLPEPAGPSFEDAIEQVEQIIERIERGEQGLERSITDYERGAGLLKKCREILARSEQRIQEIEADLSAAAPAPTRPQPRAAAPGSTRPPSRPDEGPGPDAGPDDGDDTPF